MLIIALGIIIIYMLVVWYLETKEKQELRDTYAKAKEKLFKDRII